MGSRGKVLQIEMSDRGIVRRPGVLNAGLHDNLVVHIIVSHLNKDGLEVEEIDLWVEKKWNKAQHMGGLSSCVAIEGSADCTKTRF